MFLTIKRSNISDCLTPLIMPSGCPCRGTALPCPDGCREAMPEAPKSHFLKGGLSACKRYPFGLQKTTFCEPKDGLLESTEKTVRCNGSGLPSKNAATISAEISDGKKAETAQAAIASVSSDKTQHSGRKRRKHGRKKNTARTCAGKAEKLRRRKNHAAAQPKNEAAATPCLTHIIYSAQRAENSEQEIILV